MERSSTGVQARPNGMWAAQFLRPEQLARSCGLRCGAALQPVGGLRCAQGAGESLCRVCRERVATRHDSECGYGNPCDRGERDGSLTFRRWQRLCRPDWQSGASLRGEPADAILQHGGIPAGGRRHVWNEQPRSVAWSGICGLRRVGLQGDSGERAGEGPVPHGSVQRHQPRQSRESGRFGGGGRELWANYIFLRAASDPVCAAGYVIRKNRDPSGGGIPGGSGSG